jgi:hypothetical protein
MNIWDVHQKNSELIMNNIEADLARRIAAQLKREIVGI